jgi:poly(hydroxyalkanoate) granule-associated protein
MNPDAPVRKYCTFLSFELSVLKWTLEQLTQCISVRPLIEYPTLTLSATDRLPYIFIFEELIMVKKFKSLSEGQLTQTVKDSAQQIWLAGLGAFAKAQEEGNKVFEALVKEGEAIQKKTRKIADEKFSVVRKTADEKFADVRKVADAKMAAVTGKAAGTWDRLEQVFEDRVARALSSLGVPTKKEIDKLSKRVAELTATVQKLNEGGEGVAKKVVKPAAKPAAVKPAAKPATKAAVKPAVKAAAVPAATKAVARKAAPAKKPAPTKSVVASAAEPVNAPAGTAADA